QRTLAMMTGFEQYTRKTRRAIFLEEMEQVVPWRELCALVAPHYPKPGNGRPPVGVERMLRIYFLQQWFNLSDPAVEEALYDSGVMRKLVMLYQRWETASRSRLTGAGFKPPGAAAFKRRGGERPRRSFIRIPMDIGRDGRRSRPLLSPESGAGNMTGWSSLTSKRPSI